MWPRQKVQSQNLSRRLSLEDHVRDSDPFYTFCTRDAVNKLARYCIRCGSASVCLSRYHTVSPARKALQIECCYKHVDCV